MSIFHTYLTSAHSSCCHVDLRLAYMHWFFTQHFARHHRQCIYIWTVCITLRMPDNTVYQPEHLYTLFCKTVWCLITLWLHLGTSVFRIPASCMSLGSLGASLFPLWNGQIECIIKLVTFQMSHNFCGLNQIANTDIRFWFRTQNASCIVFMALFRSDHEQEGTLLPHSHILFESYRTRPWA